MRYSYDGPIRKDWRPQRSLKNRIGFYIETRGGFVQDKNVGRREKSSCQRDKLSLTLAKVWSCMVFKVSTVVGLSMMTALRSKMDRSPGLVDTKPTVSLPPSWILASKPPLILATWSLSRACSEVAVSKHMWDVKWYRWDRSCNPHVPRTLHRSVSMRNYR